MSSQTDIKKLFNRVRRILKNPGLDLLIAPTPLESSAALIIITPARIGNAVERNTIRRRIKALFHEEKLNKNGLDYVLIIKKQGIHLSYDQLKALICNALIPTNS